MTEITGEASDSTQGPPYVDWQRGTTGPDLSSAVALRPQSLAVFRILHDNAGKAVTKEQLLSTVWPDVAVTDDSLVQCITEIRKAIGDSHRKIIRTLPKRGYIYETALCRSSFDAIRNAKATRKIGCGPRPEGSSSQRDRR